MSNEKFNEYFLSVYKDRWVNLFLSMQKDVNFKNRENLFYQTHKEMLPIYKMDPASEIVAMALEVQKEDKVLDLCAAPGGKSLILAEALNQTGELISNEISSSRRERLTRVFKEYIPMECRKNIFVKGLDGNQFGLRQPEYYNKVLADVPCSGERHLLENKSEFEKWTVRRSQNLSVRQFSLLSSAWLATVAGGRIVYSTCSISPMENDEVVGKLKKRREIEILRPEFLNRYDFLEKTTFGYQVLPDKSGFGPMYFSVIKKIKSSQI